MDKEILRQQIVASLEADYVSALQAAKIAHAAATHVENVPDNKYATLGLEASYLAQGQANRAQEIKKAIQQFRQLGLQQFSCHTPIRQTAVVQLTDDCNIDRVVFICPAAGGLSLEHDGAQVMVITPESPLGQELIGKYSGDLVELKSGGVREYEIISVC